MAMGSTPSGTPNQPDPAVTDLIDSTARRGLSIDLLVGAKIGGRLIAAWLAVESQGRAALVLGPGPRVAGGPTESVDAAVAALQALRREAVHKGIALLEILLPPMDTAQGQILERAGFRRITRLIYLRQHCGMEEFPRSMGPGGMGADIDWQSYGPETHGLFARALKASYVQSLDCPELDGLRDIDEVLAGHRSAGEFDPRFWWIAVRAKEPVGVILMSRLPTATTMEVVYMGVAQPARGTGVADALLDRAEALARQSGVTTLALAVDARNEPARRLYSRRRFIETGQRDAWIATPCAP